MSRSSLDAPPESMNGLAITAGGARRNPEWVNVDAVTKRMRCVSWKADRRFGLKLNPVVSALTTVILWGFVAACVGDPDGSNTLLKAVRKETSDAAAWLYIGTQNAWVMFIIYLYFSKYSKLKLGKDDDVPEYSRLTWFVMLFSCGVGNELFYMGVSEPIDFYTTAVTGLQSRYSHLSANERADYAILLTWFHFGLHGWAVFTIVALSVAFMGFRKDLPLIMRSCLYPILGDKVFGFLGDIIDTMCAVCTLVGVCTVLGFGAFDMNSGLARLSGCPRFSSREACDAATDDRRCSWNDLGRCKHTCEYIFDIKECSGYDGKCVWRDRKCLGNDETFSYGIQQNLEGRLLLLWGITALATLSVIAGVKVGIRMMSFVCFVIGMFLWLYVFLSDDPWFFLDVFCQEAGAYIQWLFLLGFHTDAWARHTLTPNVNLNITNVVFHEANRFATGNIAGEIREVADAGWLNRYTIFYWGIWVSWAPFVGTFIAKISRGRTIGELILGSMVAPMVYAFMWFTVFGSSGVKMERFAEVAGLNASTSPSYVFYNISTGMPVMHSGSPKSCTSPSERVGDDIACKYASRLSAVSHSDMWMDMISQYGDLGIVMAPTSMVAILLYFVTSADSGNLVIDSLCSNGAHDEHVVQKIYWATTQGAMATALIYVGANSPEDAVNGLQTLMSVGLCSGLPFTIVLCFMCASLWKACRYECGDIPWTKESFWRTDLSDVLDFQMSPAWLRRMARTIIGFIAPTYYIWSSFAHLKMSRCSKRVLISLMTLCFYGSPVLWHLEGRVKGLLHIGWFFFLSFVCLLVAIRQELRSKLKIHGNLTEDFFTCLLLYGAVADQLDEQYSRREMDDDTDSEAPRVTETLSTVTTENV